VVEEVTRDGEIAGLMEQTGGWPVGFLLKLIFLFSIFKISFLKIFVAN